MSIVLWALAGGAIGWAGVALAGARKRGLLASILIGGTGGVLGGALVAPLVAGTGDAAGAFNFLGLFAAAVGAAALLAIDSMVGSGAG